MNRGRPKSLALVSAEILAEVEQAETVKQAEVTALRTSTPRHQSDIGQLMDKLAAELRNDTNEVSYEDLKAFSEGRL